MSGGTFNYDEYKIKMIVETIIDKLKHEGDFKDDTETFSEETIKHITEGIDKLNEAYIYAKQIDLLIAGDYSEETFNETMKEFKKEKYGR